MPPSSADFIVIGGGTAGLSLASRLSQKHPELSIVVLEGAPDQTNHPLTATPDGAFATYDSEVDWNYNSIPQKALNDRVIHLSAGKSLSGATAINYGLWARGPKNDYDRWGELVGDDKWGYDGFLPYFKDFEKHFNRDDGREQHGFEGPMQTISVTRSDPTRRYPLRESLRRAWEEIGVNTIPDYNNGHPLGLGELVENWKDGKRQRASGVLDLSHVKIFCNSPIARVIIEREGGVIRATGIELADGSVISARKEVIISTGAYRTPQVLMLSGIGPAETLKRYGIAVVVDNPEVGKNYFDHLSIPVYWKVKDPEKGVAVGSPLWTNPGFAMGAPYDFLAWESYAGSIIKPGVGKDHGDSDPYQMLSPERVHSETVVCYCPVADPGLFPFDGSMITTTVLAMQNTSRGSITIGSNISTDHPVFDPNFYTTETDRVVCRQAIRRVLVLMQETSGGKEMVISQVPAVNASVLPSAPSDEEIDEHVRTWAHTWNHPAGTAAMQTHRSKGVVDSRCKVHGVKGLRVVDASVLPAPIAAHYMVCIYALGWKVADMIAQDI